jgi:hypothetical protein
VGLAALAPVASVTSFADMRLDKCPFRRASIASTAAVVVSKSDNLTVLTFE